MRISDWSSDVCSSDLHIARKIYPETRAIIEAHQAKGHRVALISSATIYQIAPAARDLDIADIKCTAYAIEDGVFTGEIIRPSRSEERRVGKECASTFRSRWLPFH